MIFTMVVLSLFLYVREEDQAHGILKRSAPAKDKYIRIPTDRNADLSWRSCGGFWKLCNFKWLWWLDVGKPLREVLMEIPETFRRIKSEPYSVTIISTYESSHCKKGRRCLCEMLSRTDEGDLELKYRSWHYQSEGCQNHDCNIETNPF